MRSRRRVVAVTLSLVAAALAALTLVASGAGAGVSGGASALTFTQGAPAYTYGLTILTNSKATKLLEIDWSCRSLKTGENDFDTGGSGLKIKHLRFSGRVTFSHQEYSAKLDGLSQPTLVRGYLKARWVTVYGPVKGTISARGCRNGKPQKLDASSG
jgi:hypothetical protein